MQKSLGGSDHYVVAYGYNNYTYPGSTDSYLGYITHYGWGSNYVNIWINSSWCYSYITLNVKHRHTYKTVGTINNTDRTEYKCSECAHRTDAAINMLKNDRYIERIAEIPQNGYPYKEYHITFQTGGNKLFQTFGSKDVQLFLLDSANKLLSYDDDSGYEFNSLFNYYVEINKSYILRVQLYNQYDNDGNINPCSVKIGITPSSSKPSDFETIAQLDSNINVYHYMSKLHTTHVICYTPDKSGTYEFVTYGYDEIDSYLYFIDPASTKACLYDDDSGGDTQAAIKTELLANKTYLLIIAAFDITNNSGDMGLIIYK